MNRTQDGPGSSPARSRAGQQHGGVNPHVTQGSTQCSLLVNRVKFSSVLSSTRRPEAGHKEPSLLCQLQRHGVLPSCPRRSAPKNVRGEKQGRVGTQRGKPPGGNGAISWKIITHGLCRLGAPGLFARFPEKTKLVCSLRSCWPVSSQGLQARWPSSPPADSRHPDNKLPTSFAQKPSHPAPGSHALPRWYRDPFHPREADRSLLRPGQKFSIISGGSYRGGKLLQDEIQDSSSSISGNPKGSGLGITCPCSKLLPVPSSSCAPKHSDFICTQLLYHFTTYYFKTLPIPIPL